MSQDNALIQALLSQIMPEWSISKQEYQPTDIANQTSQTNILQDQLQMMTNPLMQILNGTFDYSLLDDVQGEAVAAPATPNLTLMGSNPRYAGLVQALNDGTGASDAALAATAEQMAAEQGVELGDLDTATIMESPQYKAMLDVATTLQPEVASVAQYNASGGAGGMVKSEMAKQLESYGLSSDQTPDEYFSDSILQGRAEVDATQADAARVLSQWQHQAKSVDVPELKRAAASGFEAEDKPETGDGGRSDHYDRSEHTIGNSPVGRAAQAISDVSKPWLDAAGDVLEPWNDLLSNDDNFWDDNVARAQDRLDQGPFPDNGNPGHDAVMAALRKRAGQAPTPNTSGYTVGDRGDGSGDPRRPGSDVYEHANAKRVQSQRAEWRRNNSLNAVKAMKAQSGNKDNWLENAKIENERRSGRTSQRDALTRMLLSMPR